MTFLVGDRKHSLPQVRALSEILAQGARAEMPRDLC